MNIINKFYVMGRLVRSPKIKELDNGNKVTNITIAVDREYRDKEGKQITDFLNYTLWNKDAEKICDFSKKGSVIFLEGSFTDKEIEINSDKKIHIFNPVVEKYKHISNALNIKTDVENTKEEEMIK